MRIWRSDAVDDNVDESRVCVCPAGDILTSYLERKRTTAGATQVRYSCGDEYDGESGSERGYVWGTRGTCLNHEWPRRKAVEEEKSEERRSSCGPRRGLRSQRSCGLDRTVSSLNSVCGFRQLSTRRICIIKWCFSCTARMSE